MENKRIRVAITHGDTNGIGYELILKTFEAPEMLELCTPIVYGSPKAAAYHRKALNLETNFSIIGSAEEAKDDRLNLLTTFDEEVKIELGQPSRESGEAALMALDRAMTDFRSGLYDVLVTAPVDKTNVEADGFDFKGQTEYIQKCIGDGAEALTILLNERLRIGLVTDNRPFKDVIQAITPEKIQTKVRLFAGSLKRDFRISNPRIAVLSLNPGNEPGQEEKDIIAPAIGQLTEEGINAFGPYPADSFFGKGLYRSFDGVLAMYHDQGITPFMTLSVTDGVELTTGLPLVRTAPALGTGFGIAGKGVADESSFRTAIYDAIDIFRNRATYDEPLANPLKKLYHEKRDESDKVRFAIPKKHDNANKEKQQ